MLVYQRVIEGALGIRFVLIHPPTYWFVVLGDFWDKCIRRDGALEMNSGSADGVPEPLGCPR